MRNGNNSARSFLQSFNYIDPGIPKYQRGDVLTDYRLKVELPEYKTPRTYSMVNPEADPVFQNLVSLTNEGIKALVNLDFSNPAALEGLLKHLQNEGHVPGSFGMDELNSFGRFKTMTEGMDWTDPANYGLARMSFNYLELQNGNSTKAVDPLITHYLDSLKEENNIPQTMFASRYGIDTEAGKKEEDALKEQQKKEFNKYSTAADIAKASVNLADSIAIQAGATDKDSVNTLKFKNAWSSTSNGVSKLGTAGKMVSIGMDATKFLMDTMPSKTTDKFHADLYSQTELGHSVSGVAHKAEKAMEEADKKVGVFGITGSGYKKSQANIAEAKRETGVMQHVADTARDMREAAYFNTDQSYQNYRNKTAGFLPTLSVMSKNGGIIQLTNVGFSLEDEPDLFKKGGKFESPNGIETTQENIIPEGALHARKHNMSATGFDDSKITKKGIPVINDEGLQQAEIELNEIIFSLEVTKFLEELYHAYYGTNNSDTKNEIAEKVGDELVYQIIYNTDDRTDLIMAAKLGGVLTPKEEDSIVDNSYDVVLLFFKEVQ